MVWVSQKNIDKNVAFRRGAKRAPGHGPNSACGTTATSASPGFVVNFAPNLLHLPVHKRHVQAALLSTSAGEEGTRQSGFAYLACNTEEDEDGRAAW